MKNNYLKPVALAIAVLLGACSSIPKSTSLLDQTRSDFITAQASTQVTTYAPLELKQAGQALDQANAAAARDEASGKIDQLAYIAKQKIATSQEVAKRKAAEAEIAGSGQQRDQIRLDQRSAEANKAKLQAQTAQAQTAEAQRQAQQSDAVAREAQARAAQLEAQMADLAAKKTERGMVITLSDVLFGTDQARLTPDGMRTAQKLADVLAQNPQRTVMVEGFTDSTGGTAHNQQLSERRATAVRSTLAELGVSPARVATRGYGEAYSVAPNDTAANRQQNRRVEIVLSDDSGKIAPR